MSGYEEYVAYAKETTFGTPVSPPTHFLIAFKDEPKLTGKPEAIPYLRDRNSHILSRQSKRHEFTIESPLIPDKTNGKLFELLFGSATNIGNSGEVTPIAYKWEFTPTANRAAIPLTVYMGNLGQNKDLQYSGCVIREFSLDVSQDKVSCSWGFLNGGDYVKEVAATTPTYTTTLPLSPTDLQVKLNGTTTLDVQSLRLSINNNTQINSITNAPKGAVMERMETTLEIEIPHDQADISIFKRGFLGDGTDTAYKTLPTTFQIDIIFTSPETTGSNTSGYENFLAQFVLPKCLTNTNIDRDASATRNIRMEITNYSDAKLILINKDSTLD